MLKDVLIAVALMFIVGAIVKTEKKSAEIKDKKHQEIVNAIDNLK